MNTEALIRSFQPGVFRHWKGSFYYALMLTERSTNGEEGVDVVYISMSIEKKTSPGLVAHTRRIEEFFGDVPRTPYVEGESHVQMRFEFIDSGGAPGSWGLTFREPGLAEDREDILAGWPPEKVAEHKTGFYAEELYQGPRDGVGDTSSKDKARCEHGMAVRHIIIWPPEGKTCPGPFITEDERCKHGHNDAHAVLDRFGIPIGANCPGPREGKW